MTNSSLPNHSQLIQAPFPDQDMGAPTLIRLYLDVSEHATLYVSALCKPA